MGGARFLGEIIRLNKNPALLRNQPSQKGGAGITAKRPGGRKAMIVSSYEREGCKTVREYTIYAERKRHAQYEAQSGVKFWKGCTI